MDNLICSELGQGVEILQEILYNICMNTKHRGFLMAEVAGMLNIVDLTGVTGAYSDVNTTHRRNSDRAAKRQYAQNPCPIRLSAGGGGG